MYSLCGLCEWAERWRAKGQGAKVKRHDQVDAASSASRFALHLLTRLPMATKDGLSFGLGDCVFGVLCESGTRHERASYGAAAEVSPSTMKSAHKSALCLD